MTDAGRAGDTMATGIEGRERDEGQVKDEKTLAALSAAVGSTGLGSITKREAKLLRGAPDASWIRCVGRVLPGVITR